MHYAIPCSRRFFVAMHLEEAASGRFCKYCIKGYSQSAFFATWIHKIYSAVKGIVHASAVHSHTAVFCQFTDRN